MLTGDFSGQWWLPSDPDRRWGGFLKLEAGKEPRLHLAGQLSDLQHRLGSLVVEHPAILGVTALGNPVTLVAAAETGGQTNLFNPESGDTIVTAPRAYIGDHFRREEDATFRRMDLRLSLLDSWFPPPLIDQQIVAPRGRLRQASLSLKVGRQVRADMEFGTLIWGHDFATTGNQRTEARFTQGASIVATTNRRQPLDWWLVTVVKPLRYLLAISTELPISVETIRFRPWSTKPDGDVEVVWPSALPTEDRGALHQAEMLLWYGDLAGRFEPALRRWFNAVHELEPILDQFFATYNRSRSFVETRFTMTVAAAEAYHRQRIGGRDATVAVHRERMAQARSGVDSSHLDWLNQRLQNEPTLLRRLDELCRLVPETSRLVIGDRPDTFARAVRDARNLRTHLDFSHGSSPGNLRLVALTSQLGAILEAAILTRELGFDESDVARRVERASRLRRIAIRASQG